MSNKSSEVGFHLRSPRNWLNDPNGLCQFLGRCYFFLMGKEYAFAREMGIAPDLAMPGWNETIPPLRQRRTLRREEVATPTPGRRPKNLIRHGYRRIAQPEEVT
ncbi:MAG: hypothetical protein IKG18_07465 [Atopobiaceae bacterium]|nr:hypothetical protein [Atopobiaceae bacterium]